MMQNIRANVSRWSTFVPQKKKCHKELTCQLNTQANLKSHFHDSGSRSNCVVLWVFGWRAMLEFFKMHKVYGARFVYCPLCWLG